MRIRMKVSVAGTFHNLPEGVQRGDVVDIDDVEAARYIMLGYAERADQRGEEHATVRSVAVEHAVMPKVVEPEPELDPEPEKPVYGETHPPEDAPAPATKRGPGRPRKS